MVRTRSVVFGALAVLLLSFFGVMRLWFLETAGSTPATLPISALPSEESRVAVAAPVADERDDRASFLANLREAVRAQLSTYEPPQQVATAVLSDREMLEQAVNTTATSDAVKVAIQWCDRTVLESQFLASWPTAPLNLDVRLGKRVLQVKPTVDVRASTSASQPIMLASFPLKPSLRSEPVCLTHGYIGVTTDGRLIHNNDVILYQNTAANELVGYAFDGNPIYGVSDAPSDECGGIMTDQYRYQISTDRDFILGCFVSEPTQTFVVG